MPNKTATTTSVLPGQASAAMPTAIVTMPNASTHPQCLLTWAIMSAGSVLVPSGIAGPPDAVRTYFYVCPDCVLTSPMRCQRSAITSIQLSDGCQSPSPSAATVAASTAGQMSASASSRVGADSRSTCTDADAPNRSS